MKEVLQRASSCTERSTTKGNYYASYCLDRDFNCDYHAGNRGKRKLPGVTTVCISSHGREGGRGFQAYRMGPGLGDWHCRWIIRLQEMV